MTQYTNQVAVLALLESAYGTDANPVGVNAILTTEPEIKPLESEEVSRNITQPFFGAKGSYVVGKKYSCSFGVELAGSGTAGKAPAWGCLMKACGFAEMVNLNTDVSYTPLSPNNGDIDSVTIYFYKSNTLHKMTGARGTWSLEASPKTIPVIKFEFQGKYATPSNINTLPKPDYSAFVTPAVMGEGNTSNYDFFGRSADIINSLSFDIGNNIVNHQTLSTQDILITGREGSGSISIDAPKLTDKDWFSEVINAKTGNLNITHGTVDGNKITIQCPKIQLKAPEYGDVDGVLTLTTNFSLIPSDNGDDEITFKVH